jgi:hypothetical protein
MNPRCQVCTGRQRVYCCRTHGLRRTQYLKCCACKATSKRIITVDADGYEIQETDLLCHSTDFVEPLPINGMIQSQQSNNQNS